MPLTTGTRLGPYEIVSPLGAGGMGEVYKARDTRLNRLVAIKVLPDALASDPEFRERFDREARSISALDHPNICALYDVGDHESSAFLVMQYLEGETLAARVGRGALPLAEALKIATEIAGALEKAHRIGITHRDLKPGNVMLTRSGARLLDFGLAKATPVRVASRADPAAADAPTATTPITAQGQILGTLQYMSPEQLEGREADPRSDIWALGCVLYEMVTGRRPFDGKSHASLVGAILEREPPPLSISQPMLPAALDRVVRACLAKDPDERWQSAADVKRELGWIASGPDESSAAPARSPARRSQLPWMVAAGVALLFVATLPPAWREWRAAPVEAPVVRFPVVPPPNMTLAAGAATVPSAQLAISPDGRRLVFVAMPVAGGRSALWVRSLETVDAQLLAGTEDATYPFWSPDSRSIGFFAQGKLRRAEIGGGTPQTLCDAGIDARGGAWNADGVIVFSPNTSSGLFQVSAAGGAPSVAVALQQGDPSYRWPSFLPDGRRFLFFVRGAPDRRGVYAGSLGSPTIARVLGTATNGIYAWPGYLLTVRDRTLLAYPFDTTRAQTTGEPVLVAQDVGASSTGAAAFSVSTVGALVYAGGLTTPSRLTWFDREGRLVAPATDAGDYVNFRLSPDEKRLVVSRVDSVTNTADLWLVDLSKGIPARLTSDPGTDASPIWSPDGTRIVFRSDRAGGNFAFEKSATGSDAEKRLGALEVTVPTDWSPDGKFILYHRPSSGGTASFDLMLLPQPVGGAPVGFAQTQFTEINGRFSPDGRLIAYASDESGRMEVYVGAFPQAGDRMRVSTGGGSEPRWRKDGQELFYLALDGKLMAVPVRAAQKFESDAPRVLFQTHTAFVGSPYRTNYEASGDGRRFLVNALGENSAPSPITVVLNWTMGLKK